MTTAQDQQSREAYEDGKWYWVEHEGWHDEPPTIAPACYKANCDSWYSHVFSGISTPYLKVLGPCEMRAAGTLPAPENVREGEPYDNPAFEDLARTMGVWGTAQAALCAQFFLAGRGALSAGVEPAGSVYTMQALVPGGREVAHVSLRQPLPAGTLLYTAAQVLAMGRVPPGWKAVERQLLEDAEQALANFVSEHDWGDSDMVAMDNLSAVLAAAPWPPAAQERKPLFWVRLLRDGLYEGPVHANSSEGKMLRDAKPDEWHPLYLGQAEPRPQPTPFPADFAQAYWRDRSGAPDL